jgi:hypothetical protein
MEADGINPQTLEAELNGLARQMAARRAGPPALVIIRESCSVPLCPEPDAANALSIPKGSP